MQYYSFSTYHYHGCIYNRYFRTFLLCNVEPNKSPNSSEQPFFLLDSSITFLDIVSTFLPDTLVSSQKRSGLIFLYYLIIKLMPYIPALFPISLLSLLLYISGIHHVVFWFQSVLALLQSLN